jgi:hypothetical protein
LTVIFWRENKGPKKGLLQLVLAGGEVDGFAAAEVNQLLMLSQLFFSYGVTS